MRVLRPLAYVSLGVPLGWAAVDAPAPFWADIQFLAELLLVTALTRTVSFDMTLSALGLGMGIAMPLTILVGRGLDAGGLDPAAAPADWAIVPLVEETAKFLPLSILLAQRRRKVKMSFNLSDLLLLGSAAGMGFGMVENALLAQQSASAYADMQRHYGPHLGGFYLVPGAWGITGYVGHAAATGFAAAGLGLSIWLARRRREGAVTLPFSSWVPAAAAFAWVALEHVLCNLRLDTRSDAALLLGNGRLTPWLFVGVAALVVAIDFSRVRALLAASPSMRKRVALMRAALVRMKPPVPKSRYAVAMMLTAQLRLLNAVAALPRIQKAPAPTKRPDHDLQPA